MIFCCDFWWRFKYPKFYDKTVELIKSADRCEFLYKDDLTTFIGKVKAQLEADKPKGHPARVRFHVIEEGKGSLYLESGRDETDIARLFFHEIRCVKTYSDQLEKTIISEKGV